MVNSDKKKESSNWALVVVGIGVGWLIGLSISPVVSIVISSITSAAASVIAALGGMTSNETESKKAPFNLGRISALPLAYLVVGIVFGSVFGLLARNNDWLGSDQTLLEKEALEEEIEIWVDRGINKQDIVQRLFEIKYPLSPNSNSEAKGNGVGPGNLNNTKTVLFSAGVNDDECKSLDALGKTETLKIEMTESKNNLINFLGTNIEDTDILSNLVDELCK